MSGSRYDSESDLSPDDIVRSSQSRGGAHLFSPTNSEGTQERARSIHPGVRPRQAPTAVYPNHRGQPNYGTEIVVQPPPTFNVAEHSARRNARPSAPTTPRDQMDQEDGGALSTETRIVSPSTAALINQLQVMQKETEAGASSDDRHSAIQKISRTSAHVLNRLWSLRGLAKPGEAENMMDVELMHILTGLVDEYRTAEKLAEELVDEQKKARKLHQEAARARDALARAEEEAKEAKTKYDTLSKSAHATINSLSARLKDKDENENRLKETIRGLRAKEAARDQTIRSLSDQVAKHLNLGPPFLPPAPPSALPSATGSASHSSSHHGFPPPRSNLRPTAMEFQQQVLATAGSADRLRASRPTERPSGASDLGSPKPKRSSMTTLVAPAIEHDDAKLWRGKFEKLLAVVRNYTRGYWKHTQKDFASTLEKDPSGVWQHLLKAAHPANPEAAQDFITRLVSEKPSLPFLVERVINQFIVEEVLSFEAWMNWDPKTDQILRQIEQRLKETDLLDTNKRMEVITERCSVISTRLAHPKWSEWKNYRQSVTFQKLRSLVIPLAAILKNKDDAIYELFNVLQEAWELSPKIMNSWFSFKYEYPLPGQAMTSDVHNVLQVEYDEHQQQRMLAYHLQQDSGSTPSGTIVRGGAAGSGAPWGVGRLIVTPMITMRDERVTGAQTSIVVKPDVLVRK